LATPTTAESTKGTGALKGARWRSRGGGIRDKAEKVTLVGFFQIEPWGLLNGGTLGNRQEGAVPKNPVGIWYKAVLAQRESSLISFFGQGLFMKKRGRR